MSDLSSNELLPEVHQPTERSTPATPRIKGYEILGLLGEGPLGLVWRAVKSDSARLVALKLVSADVFADDAAWVHFERDADVAAQLNHPNIPRVFENAWHDHVFCLATELVEGVPLDQYALQHRLTARDVLCLMGKIGDAVQAAHECGLIHGRIKPTNILITPDGEPHVLDFGLTKLCRARTAAELTEVGETDGARACLAPEQVAGESEHTDTRTDVYSLGTVLFRLLTGQWPPQAAPAPIPIGIDADPELTALLAKAIAHDPAHRYASAGEFARDIRRYLAGEPLRAVEPTAGYWIRKAFALYRIPVAITAALLVWVVAYGVIDLLALIGERNQAVVIAARMEERFNRTSAILRRHRATEPVVGIPVPTRATTTSTVVTVVAPPSETELYTRLLQAAEQHLADGALDQADAVLWEAPPASRNASWAALLARCHRDLWTLRPASGAVVAVAISPDNKRLAIAGTDSVTLWNTDPQEEKQELRVAARAVVFSPDGRRLATTGADNTTHVWDAVTGRGLLTVKQAAHALAFTPDGTQLLLATALPAELVAVDLATGNEQRAALGNTPLTTATFAAEGRRLITGNDTQVQVWDTGRVRLLWTFRVPVKVVAVALSHDGRWAAAAGHDGRVQLWETEQGRELMSLRGDGVPVVPLLFTTDGRALLTGNTLWDLPTGKELQTYTGNLVVAAFAPGAKRLLAGQRDGAVRWWATVPVPELSVTDFGMSRDDFLKLKQARFKNAR